MVEAKRAVLVFIAIVYALSVALSLLIGVTGGYRSRWIGLGYVSMLFPAVSVLITNVVVRDKKRAIGWDRFSFEYLPLALFLMPVVMRSAMLPVAAALDRLHWQGWLMTSPDGQYHTPAARGWGVLTPAELVIRIAANAMAGLIVVSILALFEEIGWRGWLLPYLIGLTSERRAVVNSSVIRGDLACPLCLGGYSACGWCSAWMDGFDRTGRHLRLGSCDRMAVASYKEHMDCGNRSRRAEQLGTIRI